ncbi:hypothetical protein HPB50_021470 [Hyalomma asiaticum]|uniref:Uncharacterized protein n=1 Tax=Hyalomma asiaticum TaxID=266040 RepID=A0ACB7SD06_HYAAI|nr:hypothetical protein HPB50_021470 [Hyalomma asiaticum]
MSLCRKFCTFLWRRLFLQTIRRHYLALLAEILFVVVTYKHLLRHDRVDLGHIKKFNSASFGSATRRNVNKEIVGASEAYVVYGPSNDRTDKLVKKLMSYIDYVHDGKTGTSYKVPHDERPSSRLPKAPPQNHKKPANIHAFRCGIELLYVAKVDPVVAEEVLVSDHNEKYFREESQIVPPDGLQEQSSP